MHDCKGRELTLSLPLRLNLAMKEDRRMATDRATQPATVGEVSESINRVIEVTDGIESRLNDLANTLERRIAELTLRVEALEEREIGEFDDLVEKTDDVEPV